VKIGDVMFQ